VTKDAVVFYKCRWCLVTFTQKFKTSEASLNNNAHFIESAASGDKVKRMTENKEPLTWMFAAHDCDGNDELRRAGLADLIGIRYARRGE
jgi:hypothetical protein